MAKGLDELIDFLLEEIALGGIEGVTFTDLTQSVQTFYSPTSINRDIAEQNSAESCITPSPFRVDRNLMVKVWKWLAKHPDVAIGKDHEYNSHSLDEIEALYPTYTLLPHDVPETLQHPLPDETKQAGPRVFTTDDRVYFAICGHAPDPNRVFRSEIELLSCIAQTRHDGILQGDLVRATGQDKRSVPKRTDALYRKGYIDKRTVWTRGNKTSRLFLRRFADELATLQADASGSRVQPTVKDVALQLLEAVKDSNFLTQDELGVMVGLTSPSEAIVLSQIIRGLTKIGVVKRVKTAFGPAAQSDDLKICIQKLRDPEDNDWETTQSGVLNFTATIASLAAKAAMALPTPTDGESPEPFDSLDSPYEMEEQITRQIPQWTADRELSHLLLDAARRQSPIGMSNWTARCAITGPFVRRPLESLLVRLSRRSLTSQPLRVRHLAIVRTPGTGNNKQHFHHYTFEAFSERVKNLQAKWDDAEGGKEMKKQIVTLSKDLAQVLLGMRDDFGFIERSKPEHQSHSGEMTLAGLVRTAGAVDMEVRSGEAALSKVGPGQYKLREQVDISRSDPSKPAIRHYTRRGDSTSLPKEPIGIKGRPRKFMRGTEKFWRDMFTIVKFQMDPDHPRSVGKTGIMSDPVGLEIFNKRPLGFDDILTEAIKQELPVPAVPEDVSQDWMDKISHVINRSRPGVYLTPEGTHGGIRKNKSRIVVFKLDRLREVDLVDRSKPAAILFGSSSVAHTVRYLRYYPRLGRTPDNIVESLLLPGHLRPAKQVPRPTKKRKSASTRVGPRRGVFDDELVTTTAVENSKPQAPSVPPRLGSSVEIGEETDATASDPELARRVPLHRSGGSTLSQVHNVLATGEVIAPPQKVLDPRSSGSSSLPFIVDPGVRKEMTSSTGMSVNPRDQSDLPMNDGHFPPPPLRHLAAEQSPFPPPMHHALTAEPSTSSMKVTAVGAPLPETPEVLQLDDVQSAPANSEFEPPSTGFAVITTPTCQVKDSEMVDSASVGLLEPPAPSDNNIAPADNASQPDDLDRRHSGPTGNRLGGPETVSHQDQGQAVSSDEESTNKASAQPSSKRVKQLFGKNAAKTYREFVLELVQKCSGLAPNDPSTFKRAMRSRCQEAGIRVDPNVKIIKSGIKILCDGGKLKQMYFSFSKNGTMQTRTIIAVPTITGQDSRFQNLQKRMIDAFPHDYVPQEMEEEANRKPRKSNVSATVSSPTTQRQLEAKMDKPSVRSSSEPSHRRSESLRPPRVTLNDGFLSLKVPKLASIKTSTEFATHYQKDLSTTFVTQNAVDVQATPVRRSGRKPKDPRNRNARSMIQWRTPRRRSLPSPLSDILKEVEAQNQSGDSDNTDSQYSRFVREIDSVASWEEHLTNWDESPRYDLGFINHFSSLEAMESVPIEQPIQIVSVNFDFDGVEHETRIQEYQSWLPFKEVIETASQSNLRSSPRKRKVSKRKVIEEDRDEAFTPEPKRRKYVRRGRGRGVNNSETLDPTARENAKILKKHARGHQWLRYMPGETIYRILVSVICVRTLTGGIDAHLDWPIVCRLFPGQDESFLRKRWKTLASKYRSDVTALTECFQNRYLSALADDEVPSVDYENLEDSDWEGILKWAIANLDTFNVTKSLELPSSRVEFLNQNDIAAEEFRGVRDILAYNSPHTQPGREAAMCGVVFGTTTSLRNHPAVEPIEFRCAAEHENVDANIARAKSWIMSSLLTPESDWDPARAHMKLSKLSDDPIECEEIVATALKALQRDKHISKSSNAFCFTERPTGAQVWVPSVKFWDHFQHKRLITATMLREAAAYKLDVLDSCFSTGEEIALGKEAAIEDGEMVAIMNLLSLKMVRVRPGDDVPASRYGVDWQNQGYQTRSMDRKAISFGVHVQHQSNYCFGDPFEAARNRLAVPKANMEDVEGKGCIPAWYDINGNFRAEHWELLLGAVVGLISVRPGISSLEVTNSLSWAIDYQDVQLVVQFLTELGAIQRTLMGYETTKWWWMALGKDQYKDLHRNN